MFYTIRGKGEVKQEDGAGSAEQLWLSVGDKMADCSANKAHEA